MATQSRLGGALLAMVVTAAAICVVALLGMVFAFDRLREIGPPYMIAVSLVTLWAAGFLVLTAMRAPSTPKVAAAGLVAWLAYRIVVVVSTGALAHWPLVIDMLGEVVMTAGFCGYMVFGEQPSAYYRGRAR
jgi:hypothetical protein